MPYDTPTRRLRIGLASVVVLCYKVDGEVRVETERDALPVTLRPDEVHQTLARYMLADGEHLVVDLAGSHGPYVRDAKTGREYLDCYAYFASQPVGHNHPQADRAPRFEPSLADIAIHKPSNSDVYTTYMAEFVETFARVARPADMPYLFFIDGGGLAVENALKTASIGRFARTWQPAKVRRALRSFTCARLFTAAPVILCP